MKEDEGMLSDEDEDESSLHVNKDVEELINDNDALGLTEGHEEPHDELGTNYVTREPESCNDGKEDYTKLPIGQWVTMPRRSRKASVQDTLESFVDAESLENYGTGEEVVGATMLHQAAGNADSNYSMFKSTTQETTC